MSSGPDGAPSRSRIGGLLHLLAGRSGRPTATVATEWFLRAHPTAVKLDDLPFLYDGFRGTQASAPVLYMQSERFGHMELVTSGRVLPVLLHWLK